ncbi:hypothetical protein OE88DRAFT_1624769 [Heliocybe sulcata]|uniref:MYND-type domain-containing protein n=1 Tax=Heliocybe sulcata TaxID=5364 RepID=A0A5C3NJU4_9AGAM|nr:hypothetical protein OE88DRAFT_1624769 [Heliocybe sulcata]
MSAPLIWPTKTYFYPIGNTPAVCLTQDLPPGQSADVLLLGCGDARNVLYTIYSDLPSSSGTRNFDVTCCDYQPAILARNILLYVLIVEGEPIDKIWDIYYHFFIDDASLAILVRYCEKLLTHTVSLDLWNSCRYGSWLKVLDSRTLAEIRSYWQSYVDFECENSDKDTTLRGQFDKLASGNRDDETYNYSCARCAGPLMAEAILTMSELYRKFWRSGTTFLDSRAVRLAQFINPTFVYSIDGEKLEPHHGTFPLQSFHLAHAFSPVGNVSSPMGSEARVVQTAKDEFSAWCARFRQVVGAGDQPRVVLRFYTGDALAFCHGLLYYRSTGESLAPVYSTPWCGSAVHLDGADATRCPRAFDVIDTSNLTDHLGLTNVLLACVPLFKKDIDSSAILYTETLLPSGEDASRSFLGRLGGDPQVMALIFGLIPRPLLTGFQSTSHSHELLLHIGLDKGQRQFHERVAWVDPVAGDASREAPSTVLLGAATTAHDLGVQIFDLYDRTLASEHNDLTALLRPRSQALINEVRSMEDIHYNRKTFVRLLQLVRVRVRVSDDKWRSAMNVFLEKALGDPRRLVGMNYIQELFFQLHAHDLYTTDNLRNNWMHCPGIRPVPKELFRGWSNVPPVVCVSLTVPRHAFRPFTEWRGEDPLGSPILSMQLDTGEGHSNAFACLHGVAGQLDFSSEPPTIRESKPFFAAQSFVFFCWIPAWLLTFPSTTIGLTIQSTPQMATKFLSQLGPMLILYTSPVVDKDSVRILRSLPGIPPERSRVLSLPLSGSVPTNPCTEINLSNGKIITLTGRIDVREEAARDALACKADVTTEKSGPCTVAVSMGSFKYSITYPLPINGEKSKLRIARKSGYIEVIVAPSGARTPGGYLDNPFPVIRGPQAWGLHGLNLDILPVLDARSPHLKWLQMHSIFQMSDRELSLHETRTGGSDMLMNMKDSIHSILVSFAGQDQIKDHPRVYGLHEPGRGGVHTLVFVENLRLDLAAFTVVADVAVLPLEHGLMSSIRPGIQALHNSRSIRIIVTRGVEAEAWRKLLPTTVERCRTWDHKKTCEYGVESSRLKIPISSVLGEPCICSCGRGVSLELFTNLEALPGWKLLRTYATRAALGPIFAVSYVEPVGSAVRDMMKSAEKLLETAHAREERCRKCGGPGKPMLLLCSRCKVAKYCSDSCQRADWKAHKKRCTG